MSDGRPPQRSLESLLKFAIENTRAEDNTETTTSELTPERKEWLQGAIQEFINNDDVNVMKRCLEILAQEQGTLSSNNEEDFMCRENAFEQLEDVVDNIDNANDCHKLGGFDVLLRYLRSSEAVLQWRAASVLGLCCQNNPYCQQQALNMNILPELLQLVHSETSDELVNIKAMFAIASLTRANDEAEKIFVDNAGFFHLLKALDRNIKKLNIKTLFFISYLIQNNKIYAKLLYECGLIQRLVSIVQSPHDQYHEHVLKTLLEMVTHYPEALEELRKEKYGFYNTLKSRSEYLKQNDPEAYEEELNICAELWRICFGNESGEEMDR